MKRALLIVRPEPGASATAGLARARGWDALVAPLFEIAPLAWDPPNPARFDALLLTSANALRHGGTALRRYRTLPAYAVGPATARAAREAGFARVTEGPGDARSAAAMLREDARRAVLHLAGRDARPLDARRLGLTRIPVYAAQEVAPDDFAEMLAQTHVALIHSPRAGAALARRAGERRREIAIAAISPAALAAAGEGWRAGVAAERPGDDALLDAAEALAENRDSPRFSVRSR